MERKTIKRDLVIEGIGLHSGSATILHIRPYDKGIVFVKDSKRIKATHQNVIDTRLNTAIGLDAVVIYTIEHLMSALYGHSITDCEIEVEGPEMPAMDGSAMEFFRRIKEKGTESLETVIDPIQLTTKIRIEEGESFIEAVPGDFSVSYEIDFPDQAIGKQRFSFTGNDYENQIAPSRTFGRMQDVEMMRSNGLALGGGLHNAVVVDNDRILNPEGLRFSDEFVRHKVLDLLGDLWTLGNPVIARINAYKANHTLHIRLAKSIAQEGKV